MTAETKNFENAINNDSPQELVTALRNAWESLDNLEAVMAGKYKDWSFGDSDDLSCLVESAHKICRQSIALMVQEIENNPHIYSMG